MEQKFFATDCEGPISKNDNAMELAADFLPQGGTFFARVSKYDDFLADVEKRPGYRAGDTLKLILPFFKAFDIKEKDMEVFSRNHILLLPRAQETLSFISSLMPCYIISTSYSPYIRSLCQAVGHPEGNAFSTQVPLNDFTLPGQEKNRLLTLEKEIASMPDFHWPESAQSLLDLTPENRGVIERLNHIFWDEIAAMEVGRLLFEIHPVGGEEKAAAIRKISALLKIPISQSFYAGDSITDVQAFQEVNQAQGITLSFNGNTYAVREARIACLSPNTLPLSILAQAFQQGGAEAVYSFASHWNREYLLISGVHPSWIKALFPEDAPPLSEVVLLNSENKTQVGQRSSRFRKEIRGESIGALG